MKCKASIIIASYNSEKTIKTCLQSLREQDCSLPYEIIVIDSSNDSTRDIIKKEFPEVKLIHFPEKTFPGKCRNVGIRSSSGEIISFIPADCYAPPDWLSQRIHHHDNGLQIIASTIANGNPLRLLGWIEFLIEYTRQMYARKKRKQIIKDKGFLFLSYSRSLFDKIGPYPEDLFSGEDTAFVTRIIEQKIPILFDPAIVFYHINNSPLFESFRHQFIHGRDAGAQSIKYQLIDSNYPFKKFLPLYFPFVKLAIIYYRVVKSDPLIFLRLLILTPIIFCVLFNYSIGYFYGYFFKRL